ncbi:hypothetical protein Efla_002438 [Eimeria flavescens]
MQNSAGHLGLSAGKEANVIDGGAPLDLSYTYAFGGVTYKPAAPKFVGNKAVEVATLAVIVATVLALVFTLICRRLRGNVTGEGLTPRKVAANEEVEGVDDEDLPAILEECVDLLADYKRLNVVILPDETTSLSAAAQKAKLVSMMKEVASSFQPQPQRFPGRSRKAINMLEYTSEDAHGTFSLHAAAFIGSEEASNVNSLSFLSSSDLRAEPSPHMATGKAGPLANPYPYQLYQGADTLEQAGEVKGGTRATITREMRDFAHESSPSASKTAAGVMKAPPTTSVWSVPPFNRSEQGGCGEEEPVQRSVEEGSELSGQHLTKVASVSELAAGSTLGSAESEPDVHPFFRLPALLPGAVRVNLDPFTSHSPFQWAASEKMLQTLHDLFAKRALDAADAALLISTSESLVRFSWFRLGRPVSVGKQTHVLRQLGLSFMILDSVVCALQILRLDPTSTGWWKEFIRSFPTSYVVSEPSLSVRRAGPNFDVVKRLITAVKTAMRALVYAVEMEASWTWDSVSSLTVGLNM